MWIVIEYLLTVKDDYRLMYAFILKMNIYPVGIKNNSLTNNLNSNEKNKLELKKLHCFIINFKCSVSLIFLFNDKLDNVQSWTYCTNICK